MTDNDRLADNNIKHFGKLSTCHQYPTDIDSESISSCLECRNDHSLRGNIKDDITFIDTLPQLFPAFFKDQNGSNCKLQEFVN